MNDDADNSTRQTDIPAIGETDLDDNDAHAELTADTESNKLYQDDLDYKDSDTDPVIDELTDSPAEELGIPEDEFRNELDKYVDTDIGTGDDDMRETIEDRDEDDDNSASNTQ
jgi:hypothetical protein